MQGFNVKCLLMGHDDLLRTREQRLFLTCVHCGRETHGWDLTSHAEREAPAELSREARCTSALA